MPTTLPAVRRIRRAARHGALAMLAVLPLASAGTQPTPPRPTAPTLALRNVTVIDGTGGAPRPDQTVVVRDGRIVAVGPAATTTVPPDAELLDAPGQVVLPGFVDVHAHLAYPLCTGRGAASRISGFDAARSVRMLRLLVASGITTARSPATPTALGVRLRDTIARGHALGPRFLVAGELMTDPRWTEERIREEVRAQALAGVDYVKVYAGFDATQVRAAVREAGRWGLPVIGHLQRTSWTEGARLGVQFITHGANWSSALLPPAARARHDSLARTQGMRARIAWLEALDLAHPVLDTMVAALVEHGVSVDPTLVAYDSRFSGPGERYTRNAALALVPELVEQWRRCGTGTEDWTAGDRRRLRAAWPKLLAMARRLHDAGVPLTTGSDATNPWVIPGESLHQEMELLVEAGMRPLDVLTMATRNGARSLGLDDETGTVQPGKRADLVVLAADPLADIRNTRTIRWVLLGGVPYRPAELLPPSTPSR